MRANVCQLFLQLPDEIIASLEDSGVKYIPYVSSTIGFGLFSLTIAQERRKHRRGGNLIQ